MALALSFPKVSYFSPASKFSFSPLYLGPQLVYLPPPLSHFNGKLSKKCSPFPSQLFGIIHSTFLRMQRSERSVYCLKKTVKHGKQKLGSENQPDE